MVANIDPFLMEYNKSEFNLSFVYLLQVLKILRNILLILCFWYSVFHKSLSICIHSKLVLILLVFLIYQTTPTTNGGEIVGLSPLKLWIQIPLRRGQNDWATILPFGPVTLIFYWPKQFFSGQPKASPHFRHWSLTNFIT
jgi:hypothetical protein